METTRERRSTALSDEYDRNNDIQSKRWAFVSRCLNRKYSILLLLAQQTAKETIYSLVIVTGVVALGGLCYLILHDLYSRETPLGIYKEASRLCLADLNVSTENAKQALTMVSIR